ncbi:hypothetical protein [Estrella lausannensis]|uniref:Uncharacterized protein n=1 Tax=Estrella lausannensis TaxID=483423 RepID=A0A0H5E873_9BACT|nr:hypothetical protein [Estrella lausannensis]CRX39550.1 hypothetical protein ELAC_2230 [Estrella lausannensis]
MSHSLVAKITPFPPWKPLLFLAVICRALLHSSLIDIEASSQSFVLESKKIEIPGYPHAFNPSIIRFQETIYMTFRVMIAPARSASSPHFGSRIGIVELNDDFTVKSVPQLLRIESLFREGELSANAEDARLIEVGGRLYIVFSDTADAAREWGSWRVFIAELDCRGNSIEIVRVDPIRDFPGASNRRREKNWVPFEFEGHLLLSYSLAPHRVFLLSKEQASCREIFSSDRELYWPFGEMRGGTPALLIDSDRYLSFFHSSCPMATIHSDSESMPHYFFGAYTFSSKPPFHLLSISPDPIVGLGFYTSANYAPYWHPVRVVFPCGFLIEADHFWVFFGKQDHECWAVKLDRQRLLDSLSHLK